MELFENKIQLNILYDMYGELLTDSQREIFESYYGDDLSLQEIADNRGISRNAVHDSLKKTISHLELLESTLHGVEKAQKREELYKKLENNPANKDIVDALRAIEEE